MLPTVTAVKKIGSMVRIKHARIIICISPMRLLTVILVVNYHLQISDFGLALSIRNPNVCYLLFFWERGNPWVIDIQSPDRRASLRLLIKRPREIFAWLTVLLQTH